MNALNVIAIRRLLLWRAAAWRLAAPYLLVPAVGALLLWSETATASGHSIVVVRIGAAMLMGLIVIRQVAAHIDNNLLRNNLKQAFNELEDQSRRLVSLESLDAMTGLANHRGFHERFSEELRTSQGNGRQLALLMMDIDHFKRLNDAHGHTAGDEVLKTVSDITQKLVRKGDLVARYGGEEFAILLQGLPDSASDTACAIAERIRSAVASHPFQIGRVTVSIGVAPSPIASQDSAHLLKRANHALYTAKHYGRNRVVIAEDLSRESSGCAAGQNPPPPTHLKLVTSEPATVNGFTISTLHNQPGRREEAKGDIQSEPGGQILAAMLALLDLRDSETEGHSQRVARYAMRLADEIERLGIAPVTERDRKQLGLGALLHDVGKIGVPDSILKKPEALTDNEWEIMRRHPSRGASLLARFPIMSDALPVVRHHHERWDGMGYPDRLVGDEIPLSARIFAMADTFDAMSSDRVYRKALPFSAIVAEFHRVAGTQFDPDLVAAFLAISEEEWIALRKEPSGGLGSWRLREVPGSPLAEAA